MFLAIRIHMDSFCFADQTLGHQCNREETFSKDVHNNNTYPFFSSTMRSLWNEVNVIVKYCKIGLRQFRVALKPSVPADSGILDSGSEKRCTTKSKHIKTWIRARDSRLKPLTFNNRWPRQVRKMEVKICFIHQMCWSVFDCFTVVDLFYFLYVFYVWFEFCFCDDSSMPCISPTVETISHK